MAQNTVSARAMGRPAGEFAYLHDASNANVADIEALRLVLRNAEMNGVIYSAANSGGGAGLSVDAAAQDAETDFAIDIRCGGLEFPLAAQAAIDISTKTIATPAATISTSASGAAWVFANPSGTVDVETDITTAAWTSAIQALAQYGHATRTLPPTTAGTEMVPIGCIRITENASGPYTWGTDSITAEGGVYFSFNGQPGIITTCASLAKDTGAATFTYGAGKVRLGTGTVVSYTGKAGVTLSGSNVAVGNTGAWVVYLLADDVEIAVQVTATGTDATGSAFSAVHSLKRNPLLPIIAEFYVTNRSTADFVPGTTNLDATGISFSRTIRAQLVNGVDQYSDMTGFYVGTV